MKKFLVIMVLAAGTAVIAVAGWRVATGRGLWNSASEPTTSPGQKAEVKEPQSKQPAEKQPVVKATNPPEAVIDTITEEALAQAEKEPNTVALIGEYAITKDELRKQLISELQPYDYDGYGTKSEPTDAKTVLLKMIADKAIIIEGRKNGALNKEMTYNTVKKFGDRRLVNLLMQKQLEGKLTASDAEIEAQMKSDPKLDRARAEQAVKRTKANTILGRYYADLNERSNVKKITANFAKAAQIHQRLLFHPIVERRVAFIRNSQIRDELTEAEKNIVLATFDGGKVTLKDWFMVLGDIAPPHRPKDLNTAEGVEKLLEQGLRIPILVAEATRLKLYEDKEFQKKVREYEDTNLLADGRQTKQKEVPEPNSTEIKAYFDEHKEEFLQNRKIKGEQIWCSSLKTAQAAKAKLHAGEDFNSVKVEYTLDKEGKASDVYPNSEAYFWPDLWAGEPNEVVGPVKGMHRSEFKWRLVKILEKHPGTIPEFDEQMANRVKWHILAKKREALMEQYRKELLSRYEHKIYYDRFEDLKPLDIP